MTTPTLTTAGTAYREQQPSLATVEVTVRSDSDEPAVARSTARDRAETIRNSLTAVSTDQVDTVDIRVQEADEVFGPDTDSDYRAEERLMNVSHQRLKMSLLMLQRSVARFKT